MAWSAAELTSEDLFYGYLPEYLDGELAPELSSKVEAYLKQPGKELLPAQFQAARGRLQLALQSYYLKEDEATALTALVQDPRIKATIEATQIDALSRDVVKSTWLRGVALGLIAAGVIGFAVWKYAVPHEQRFKPLEYLGYEAIAMEEDAQERLNLPSHDAKEIRQYLQSYPGLDFHPRMLRNIAGNWQLDGATVIDYEIAKVAAVMYENTSSKTHERLFHFSFAGQMSDLPFTEPGNMRGLIFQTYASDELNLVAWQSAPNVVSLLVGRRSAPELAEIAVAGNAD